MGDMADMALDDGMERALMDGWGDWSGNRRTNRRPATNKICIHCDEGNLRWGNVPGGGWRLHTKNGVLHECYRYQPTLTERADD